MGYVKEFWTVGNTVLVVILTFCLVLLLTGVIKNRRKRRNTEKAHSLATDCQITQELPTEAVLVGGQSLTILADILYCESEEIIS